MARPAQGSNIVKIEKLPEIFVTPMPHEIAEACNACHRHENIPIRVPDLHVKHPKHDKGNEQHAGHHDYNPPPTASVPGPGAGEGIPGMIAAVILLIFLARRRIMRRWA